LESIKQIIRMKKLLFVHIILLASMLVYAQAPVQNLRGKVTDQASKSPLPFVTVVIPGTTPLLGTTTDIEGHFVITDVPVGRYEVRFSFVGYETVIISELMVSSSKEVFVEVDMRESFHELDEVSVRPRVIKEEPLNQMAMVSARMLSVEEARRYAGGFDDPARLASAFAGVASNMVSNGIVVRGNSPKSLQWRMEGIEIPNPNHFADIHAFGGGGLTALSSQMLANSDFLTGAFPAEFTNALSGVFDMHMRTGSNRKRESTFQLGIVGIDLASEGPFTKGGNASYLFNYRYSTFSLLMPLLPEEAQGTNYQDLAFKLNFPTAKSGVFTVWGLGLIDRSGQQAITDSLQWEYLQNREEGHTRQHMGAAGTSHSIALGKRSYLRTSLAATVSGMDWETKRLNNALEMLPQSNINVHNWNLVFTSAISTKLSNRHQNRTGITITGLLYDMLMEDAIISGSPPMPVVDEHGSSSLVSVYSSSSWQLSQDFMLNAGMSVQFFTLNSSTSLEPRLGLKWQLSEWSSLGIGYGLHSRLERINTYFTRDTTGTYINKGLGFTRAHHIVLGYNYRFSPIHVLRIEPYVQFLTDVPVEPGTTFSAINLQNDWFVNTRLENSGLGRNMGIDLTLERFMRNGYYYLFTASLFKSTYRGGDLVWRSTMYDRTYLVNMLFGKEWKLGENKQNLFGINLRLSLQGGDRYTAVDEAASVLAQDVVYDEENAFAKQLPAMFLAHFTTSYRINRQKTSWEIALMLNNATNYSDFHGFRYNFLNNSVEEHREALMIPNLSFRVHF
jgi:hypothetical protein